MSESRKGTRRDSAENETIKSDLAKVDAYENTPEDYEEIPELDDEFFARATYKPARGRPPQGSATKEPMSIRLDPAIGERFRSSGPGWQGRMNDFLAANAQVLEMIVSCDDLVRDMEALIRQLDAGELTYANEAAETTVARMRQNIRNIGGTLQGLREQLVWEPQVPAG